MGDQDAPDALAAAAAQDAKIIQAGAVAVAPGQLLGIDRSLDRSPLMTVEPSSSPHRFTAPAIVCWGGEWVLVSTVSSAALAIDATCITGRPVAESTTVIGWSACPASIRARHSASVGSRLVSVISAAAMVPGRVKVAVSISLPVRTAPRPANQPPAPGIRTWKALPQWLGFAGAALGHALAAVALPACGRAMPLVGAGRRRKWISGTRCSSAPPVRIPQSCRRTAIGGPGLRDQSQISQQWFSLGCSSGPANQRILSVSDLRRSKAGTRHLALFVFAVGHWLLTSSASMPPTGRSSPRAWSTNLAQ